MKLSLKLSPLLLAVIGLAALLIYLNLPEEPESKEWRTGATPVVLHQVAQSEFAVTVEALGTGRANEAVTITAQQAEVVEQIHFDDGDKVQQGDLLVSLDNREEQARLHELQINLQEAKRQLQRISNLAKESVASQQLLDEQQAKVKALSAQLEVAEAKLAELAVRAPFAGVLGVREVSVGALVTPGEKITTLDDLSKIKVDFSISENHLASLAEGQQVIARTVAYPGENFEGEISSINTRVDPITRSLQVRAILDNEQLKLRPGMLLQINIEKQSLDTLVIPEKALLPIEDKQYVFVVNNGKAEQRQVSVGMRKPGLAQITQGLDAGEQIVVEGALRLNDGSSVSVLSAGL